MELLANYLMVYAFSKNNCSACMKIVYFDLSCGKEQKIAYVCFRFLLIKHVLA